MMRDAKGSNVINAAAGCGGFPGSHRLFSSVVDATCDPHLNGKYHANNPTWHVEYSPWKAANVYRLIREMRLRPQTICEVGCGAGEVLRQLQMKMDPDCQFWGYDIAPAAIELAQKRTNERLRFEPCDFTAVPTPHSDLLLVLEVVDHVENYLAFLRTIRPRADWKIFSFSLDISAQAVLRKHELLRRREMHSHLHHFNKDTVLASLQDTGYEIVHYRYQPSLTLNARSRISGGLRQLTSMFSHDLAARTWGGYSLLVVAR